MAISAVSTPQLFVGNQVRSSAPAGRAPESSPAASDSVNISAPSTQQPSVAAPQAPAGEASAPADVTPKKWTVLIWSNSDNNLYRFLQSDLDEAEKIGSTSLMNVVAQTDHAPKGGTTQRLKLETDNTPGLTSPVLQDLGDTNMADPNQLSDFIQWGIKNFPAENYFLVISDHGAGWQGACHDESKNGWMSLPMIEQGLMDAQNKTGKKLDVIGFDACLMANAEVMHQLKDTASYIVGSEEVEGGAGWTYNRVLSREMLSSAETAMRARVDFSPKEFADNVVASAKASQGDLPTMTAVDTSKVQNLTDAMKVFSKAIIDSPVTSAELGATARKTQKFRQNADLGDFAAKVAADHGAKDPKLAEAAKAVSEAIQGTLSSEQHSPKYPGATGLTIELNKQTGVTEERNPVPNLADEAADRITFDKYKNTKFDQDVNWSAALNKIRG